MENNQLNVDILKDYQKYIYNLIDIVSFFGLMTILGATIVAIYQEILIMWFGKKVHLADLLLLFIYLEVIAMVGIYFKSSRLPVRFPIMIAMVALARHIILDAGDMAKWEVLAFVVSIFVLGITITLLKYGNKFDAFEHRADSELASKNRNRIK